jgi:hypothetical protein
MFKKIALLFVFMGLISATATANFYVGGTAGLSILKTKEQTDVPPHEHNLGGYGFVGGGFVGYYGELSNFLCCNCLDYEIEGFVFGNAVRDVVKHFDTDTQFNIHSRWSWGVRALPGIWFRDCFEIHLIAGYIRGYFRAHDTGAFGFINKNFSVDGYEVGSGILYPITNCLWMRLDGVYNGYARRTLSATSTTGGPNSYQFSCDEFNSTVALIFQF